MQKYEFNKRILSDFSWNNLTWLVWMLLIGEFLNTTLNLEQLLKNSIKENWNPKKITHGKVKIIIQKIYGILTWYKTNNIDKYIKNDSFFKELLLTVVPKTTVNRILNNFCEKIEKWLQKVILEIEKYNISVNNKENVIVDIDTTYDPASENIEKATFNTHYWTTGYSPILAFDWLTWDLITWKLRPWNFACSKEALEFIKEIVELRKWLKKEQQKNKDLENENKDLKWKLNTNMTNSGNSSSTERFKKKKKLINLRTTWRKPRWWQKWYKWSNLTRN